MQFESKKRRSQFGHRKLALAKPGTDIMNPCSVAELVLYALATPANFEICYDPS